MAGVSVKIVEGLMPVRLVVLNAKAVDQRRVNPPDTTKFIASHLNCYGHTIGNSLRRVLLSSL